MLGNIATVSNDNKSESALIGFSETDDLYIIFGTDSKSRKYENLVKNSSIAFVSNCIDDHE